MTTTLPGTAARPAVTDEPRYEHEAIARVLDAHAKLAAIARRP